MKNYYLEIKKSDEELFEKALEDLNKYNNRRSSSIVCFPDYKNCSGDKMALLVASENARFDEEPVETLTKLFGEILISVKELDSEAAYSYQELLKEVRGSLSNGICCDDSENLLTLKNYEETESDIENMIGFAELKKSLKDLKNYINNARNIRGNYNIAFVLDDDFIIDTTFLAKKIYFFYLTLGIIKDPVFAAGAIRDAAQTDRNTSFLYEIEDEWMELSDGEHRLSRRRNKPETYLKKIAGRKTIYITSMTRKSYELCKETVGFKRVFPYIIPVKEMTCEEKLEYLKYEAKSYAFEINSKGLLRSDFLKSSPEVIKDAVSIAVKEKMSNSSCDFKLALKDLAKFKSKKDKKKINKKPLDELEELIGLKSVKKCVKEIVTFIKNRGKENVPCMHMVFRGNPGTGKTTVARIIGKILSDIGALEKEDIFIEADRNRLVSIYLGGTAAKTAEVVEEAMGGVLFIDEAYSLNADGRDYGKEAVNALVKLMEDHRHEFVCIMAGYTEEMNGMLDMNPGLRERVQFYIDFPDYNAAELMEIFENFCQNEKYKLNTESKAEAEKYLGKIVACKDKNFANGRIARKIFERVKFKQAMRGKSNNILKSDIKNAFADDDIKIFIEKSSKGAIGFRVKV